MARVIFNTISIEKKIVGALTERRFRGLAYNAANTRLVFAEKDLEKNYENHPVTKELREGEKAQGSVLGSYGNLVAFLGLEDGDATATNIKEIIMQNITMPDDPKFIQTKKGVTYRYKVNISSLQQLYDETPQGRWSSRSIVEMIEKGVGNFSFFIFRLAGLPGSVSGTGLQRKANRGWEGAPNIPRSSPKVDWIKGLLDKFKARFS